MNSLPDPLDISNEAWRIYTWVVRFEDTTAERSYRIANPVELYFDQFTHHVVDDNGNIHTVPAPGISGCVVLRHARDRLLPQEIL